MSDTSDKQLEELFPDDLDAANLKKVVKKARLITTLRTILISIVASVIVLSGAFLGNIQLLNISRSKLESSLLIENQISGPNVFLGNETMHDGWFGGQLEMQKFKIIEGVPIPWGTTTYDYNIFGDFSPEAGSYGPSPQISTSDGIREYNSQTEQRQMTFYHPEIKYSKYMNDLSRLKNIPNGDVVELAISFDKSYDFNQITRMVPNGVHPVWYWVNTYSEQDLKSRALASPAFPMMTYEVYGFGDKAYVEGSTSEQTPKDFVDSINQGMTIHGSFQGIFSQIHTVLSHGKGSIRPSDIKIIGMVVTGTPTDLMLLQGKRFVKAAVLGAITNPYHS